MEIWNSLKQAVQNYSRGNLTNSKVGKNCIFWCRCKEELQSFPAKIERNWRNLSSEAAGEDCIRVLQWNHLSQCLGTKCDKLVRCDPRALLWTTRRWRILEELLAQDADIICLQEVDHFDLLERALGSVGYSGRFLAKPDSPCIYMEGNTGPDGK